MAENPLTELEYRLLINSNSTTIRDGDLTELMLESELVEEAPETKPAPATKARRHRNEPSLEEADYFADYDVLVTNRLEAIIAAKSGKKAQFATATDLEILLQPYADTALRSKETPLEPMWVDIQYPTHQTMSLLMRLFGVHPLTAEDCLVDSEKEIQKFEIFEGYRFVSFAEHHAIPGTNIWSSIDVHMIMPTDSPVLIVLHNGPVSYISGLLNRIQALSRVKNPLLSGKGVRKRTAGECAFPSPEWLMYAILDQIVDQFLDLVYECTVEVERLEEMVFVLPAREQSDFLRRIGAVRSRMVTLRLQLLRKNDVIKNMIIYASEIPLVSNIPVNMPQQKLLIRVAPNTRRVALTTGMKNVRVFMRDIQDHVLAMLVDLEQGKEELLAIANTFTARISTQLSLADKEQNQLMKFFNALAAIVLPLTFVTALWGMNCAHVPWKDTKSLKAFGGLLGTLLGTGVAASFIFYVLDWF